MRTSGKAIHSRNCQFEIKTQAFKICCCRPIAVRRLLGELRRPENYTLVEHLRKEEHVFEKVHTPLDKTPLKSQMSFSSISVSGLHPLKRLLVDRFPARSLLRIHIHQVGSLLPANSHPIPAVHQRKNFPSGRSAHPTGHKFPYEQLAVHRLKQRRQIPDLDLGLMA